MSKIEYIISQPKEIDVLDIYQYQNISRFENFLNLENGKKFLRGFQFLGYLIPVETVEGKLKFSKPNSWGFNSTYNNALILIAKRFLTFYHLKRTIRVEGTPYWSKEDGCIIVNSFDIDCSLLTTIEKGLLTKILKVENKRKKLYGKP
jgi:hypothetical protein